ncbi:cobyric acid synthase [uncultured Clostridium sp.]|uniref:cobyric acid synthase n=1 Tax=uncultured Clostridium sp. TaxID=59620 RepID=UPI0026336296|nr:cobyric acid synthase [uncultured Clostridium sp.]
MLNNKIAILGIKDGVGKTLISICIGKLLKERNIEATSFKPLEITNKITEISEKQYIGYMEKLKLDALNKEASIDNNPIVIQNLKNKTKVFVKGSDYAKAEAFNYKDVKKDFEEFMYSSFEEISKSEEYILIEGTGECLEYVDREEEFLNFNFAKNVNADIVLVSDYLDNNSFANIYGTLSLITKEDRKRIKGIIINGYNGDMDYLKRGLAKLEKRLKIPFLGVMPEINTDILTEEDYGKQYRFDKKRDLIIGVVKFPGISHVSDFYPFEDEKEVKMLLIETAEQMELADFIVVPGSKNTLRDLEYMKEKGLEEGILKAVENGKTVMGICGGMQMLGSTVEDLYSIDNKGTKLKGLDLLPLKTTYTFVNKTTIAKGNVCNMLNNLKELSGSPLYGYESIEGETEMLSECEAFMIDKMNNIIGFSNKEGNVFGTYMHGVFESKEFRRKLLKILKARHGVVTSNKKLEEKSFSEYKEKRFVDFYDIFKENINIDKLNKILNGEQIQ